MLLVLLLYDILSEDGVKIKTSMKLTLHDAWCVFQRGGGGGGGGWGDKLGEVSEPISTPTPRPKIGWFVRYLRHVNSTGSPVDTGHGPSVDGSN